MKTKKPQQNYEIIFKKLNHFRLENADVTILCDDLDNYLATSYEIINEIKNFSEVNLANNVQYYSGV